MFTMKSMIAAPTMKATCYVTAKQKFNTTTQPGLGRVSHAQVATRRTDTLRSAYFSRPTSPRFVISAAEEVQQTTADRKTVKDLEDKTKDRRLVDKSEILAADPYGNVEDYMTEDGTSISQNAILRDVLPALERHSGYAVMDDDGKCVGIISDKDLFRAMREKEDALSIKVSEIMSKPPITVRPHAKVAYAAGLMLQHQIHRMPVVDKDGKFAGIVTRKDVFEQLLCDPEVPDDCGDPIYRETHPSWVR